MANKEYYDDLDLRYPELAICLDRIDRCNPGKLRFYVPILTPNLDTKSLNTSLETVFQTGSTIENQSGVNISSVQIQNYIEITLPKELTAFVGGDFWVKNVINMDFVQKVTWNGSTDWYHHGHVHTWFTGWEVGYQSYYFGILNQVPTDEYRYIDPGSKWLVIFLGGDISKPQIIAPYAEPESQT